MQTPSEPVALVIPADSGLEPESITSLKALFEPFFIQAEDWRVKALACKVTSIEDKRGMKFARESRLALREIRISVEKRRKEAKEDSLRRGKAIDGFANIFKAAVEPIEEYLLEQEQFAERAEAAERQRLKEERESVLAPFLGEGQPVIALEMMSGETWDRYLADARMLHEAKQEAARKAEADRIAKEQAEEAERARVIAENARLKAEAEQAEHERIAAAKEAQRALDEATAKAKAELAKAQAEAAAEAARVKAEQESEARKEALRQQALREVERQKAESERIAREKAEAELAKARAEKEAKEREEQAVLDRAAAAPDKQKMAALAKSIRALSVPQLTSKKGAPLVASITEAIEALAQRVELAASKL